MIDDNKKKIQGKVDKQLEEARATAAGQRADIASLVMHDLGIKSARIDAELAKKVAELTDAANEKKAALQKKADDTVKLQVVEVDRNLESTIANIQAEGQLSISQVD